MPNGRFFGLSVVMLSFVVFSANAATRRSPGRRIASQEDGTYDPSSSTVPGTYNFYTDPAHRIDKDQDTKRWPGNELVYQELRLRNISSRRCLLNYVFVTGPGNDNYVALQGLNKEVGQGGRAIVNYSFPRPGPVSQIQIGTRSFSDSDERDCVLVGELVPAQGR